MTSISPLRYPGGKTRAIKKFEKYLPKDVKTVCSPFFGGGSFELFCIKNHGIKVVGYDLYEPVITFWNCLIEDPERLAAIVSTYLPVVTKEQFYQLQSNFRQIEDTWERAGAAYVLNRCSFSGTMEAGGMSPLEKDGRNGRFREANVEFLKGFRVPPGMLLLTVLLSKNLSRGTPTSFFFSILRTWSRASYMDMEVICRTLIMSCSRTCFGHTVVGYCVTTIVPRCDSSIAPFMLWMTGVASRGAMACPSQRNRGKF